MMNLISKFLFIAEQESDLRELRKTTADVESQNSVLELHIERLKTAIERLEVDTNERKEYNNTLQNHLEMLRSNFLTCFAHMPLPGIIYYFIFSIFYIQLQY